MAARIDLVLRASIADLEGLGARCALVGGLAVSALTEPRFTRDIDLAVAVEGDREAEALIFALRGRGYRTTMHLEQVAASRLATMRLVPPSEDPRGVVLDLLFASSGIEPEIVDASLPLEVLPGVTARVARIGHLIVLKLLARDDRTRPQDRVDLVALLRTASDDDLSMARSAIELVNGRGYARGRDLSAALDAELATP